MEIGERIKLIRQISKLNQKELGNILGISYVAVGNIENMKNNISIDNIIKICNYFDISADFLIFGKDESENIAKLLKKKVGK